MFSVTTYYVIGLFSHKILIYAINIHLIELLFIFSIECL